MKKLITAATAFTVAFALLTGCGGNTATTAQSTESEEAKQETVQETEQEAVQETAQETEQEAVQETAQEEPVEIQVFIAASLNTVMQDVKAAYEAEHPNVTIVLNPDSSGKLLTQIEEGYECDVFFSAAQKQMNTLQDTDGLVVEGTRHNVVNNQVVVVARKDSGTSVTGLADIGNAESIALADGSVPVGRYTRVAMAALGILPETEDPSVYTTQEVSDALGGVEISEQSNVSKVLAAVVEGSCELGTTYYSDTYGYEDQLDILEKVSYDLTGNVIYPIAQVKNDQASDAQAAAAADFVEFVASDQMKPVFEGYYFDTNVRKRQVRQLIEVARTLDWRPLWISLKTGVLSTAVCFVLGILAAWRVMYCRGKHRSILDAILTLPMVLPPTVAGFFLLLFFSRRRPLGIFLFDHFGIKIVQSQVGCVIAASVIAFPLMYRSARAAFEQVDINLLYAGRTLGMSDPEIFFKVILPCARPGITSGTVLAFARAIGEYGATSMLAGNIPGKTATISQRIAMVIQDQNYLTAGVWVTVMMVIALIVLAAIGHISQRSDAGRGEQLWK